MKLKEKLTNKDFVIGTWCDIPSSATANILAKAGLDFIIIDMEHGPMDFKVAQEMIFAAEADNCDALIRVASLSETHILRAMDLGGSGIVVPHIECEKDIDEVIMKCKFAPEGNRGFNPYVRSGNYNSRDNDYLARENRNKLVVAILEGLGGIENLDVITEKEGVDVIYIGVYDLSVALGVPGQVKSELVINNLKNAVKKINDKGKAAGAMIHDKGDIAKLKEIGVQFLVYKVDTSVLYDSYEKIVGEVRK